MVRVESAENWPGMKNSQCEVVGGEKKWDGETSSLVLSVLKSQYELAETTLPSTFEKLSSENVRTVTVGHQLQLFGGPAFLHYKVITAIRKARELDAVPVFWLASEDHDFAEVQWVFGESEKHIWQADHRGEEVGRITLTGLLEAFESWNNDLEEDVSGVKSLLEYSIQKGHTYAQFYTRLLNHWYGEKGLVVIDASHSKLKEHFSKILAQELEGNGISKLVSSGKVVPRVVNLFYSPFGRERVGIIRTERGLESGGEILNPEGMCWKEWSKENAGSLSPSVLLRPVYQEFLLPNSHVVLGPSELKYWAQLKDAFKSLGIVMPTLYLRDHVLVLSKADYELFSSLGWGIELGWWTQDDFIRVMVDAELKNMCGVSIEEIEKDEVLLQALEILGIEFGAELKGDDLNAKARKKLRKTVIKKVRRSLKEGISKDVEELISAHSRVMNKIIPQDRWGNFHVLSKSVGGFENLRDKLLETKGAESPVMQVIVGE